MDASTDLTTPARPTPWLVFSLTGFGACLWCLAGGIAISELLEKTPDLTLAGWLRFGWLGLVVALCLPLALLGSWLVVRGRNRFGGWVLLAIPLAILTVASPSFQGTALGLSPFFAAALLAGHSGATRSRLLVISSALALSLAILISVVPDLIRNRLHTAAELGSVERASRWLSLPFGHDAEDRTAILCRAVEVGDVAMVEMLLTRGAEPDSSCPSGATPLQVSMAQGSTDVSLLLLEARSGSHRRPPGR